MFGDQSAEHIAEQNSNRQSEHEYRSRSRSAVRRIQIADQGIARRSATGFADSNEHSRDEQRNITPGSGSGSRKQTPGGDANAQYSRTISAISPTPKRDSDRGVNQREGHRHVSEIRIGQLEFINDRFADRSRNLTVEKIHHVDGEQHRQRKTCVSVV